MKFKKVKYVALAAFGMALLGCSQSPMDALSSDSANSKYDAAYWVDASKNNTTLYSQAVQYCAQNASKPNCAAVLAANSTTMSGASAPVSANPATMTTDSTTGTTATTATAPTVAASPAATANTATVSKTTKTVKKTKEGATK